jgi:hypothetical protein
MVLIDKHVCQRPTVTLSGSLTLARSEVGPQATSTDSTAE